MNLKMSGVWGCREDSALAWNTLEVASSSQEEGACLPQVNPCLPEVNVLQREVDVSLNLTLPEEVAPSRGN